MGMARISASMNSPAWVRGMVGRHAIGEQDALGQLADVFDGDQHGSNIL